MTLDRKQPKAPNKSTISQGPLSALDIKKKKIIQQIRTMLNDYPGSHPLAHKVLISANYRVLYDLHLNLMGLDGLQQIKNHPSKTNKVKLTTQRNHDPASQLKDNSPIKEITQALERAKRLAEKRRTLRVDDQNKEENKEQTREYIKNVAKKNPFKDLDLDLDLELNIN